MLARMARKGGAARSGDAVHPEIFSVRIRRLAGVNLPAKRFLLRSRFKKIQDANAGSRFQVRIEAQGLLDAGHHDRTQGVVHT